MKNKLEKIADDALAITVVIYCLTVAVGCILFLTVLALAVFS